MINLNEGLLQHDLDYLMLPMLDIDTYESKIDNARAVVVAFYIFEQKPAEDLERFIERGSIEILDAETSPAPTEDGYYVVFIELARNKHLPNKIMDIVETINNLTNIKEWQFKTIDDDTVYDLTEENLKEHLTLDSAEVEITPEELKDEAEGTPKKTETPKKEKDVAEQAADILRNGLMEHIEVRNNMVALHAPNGSLCYKVAMVSHKEPSVPIIGLEIGNPLIKESNLLSNMLGQYYAVHTIDSGLLVESDMGYIILEPIS